MNETQEKNTGKKLVDCMEDILKMPVTDAGKKDFLSEFGLKEEQHNHRMLLMAKLLKKALDGDVPAIREVRSILQEAESADKGLLTQILEAVRGVG